MAVELASIDPGENRWRRYTLREQRVLWGGVDLIVVWGRIGHEPRMRIERFGSDAELEARRRELLARRVRHGYVDRVGPL